MAQAPEYVFLVYGAVKLLLVVQVNHSEMKQHVEEYINRIKTKFDTMDLVTTYFPFTRLVQAIGRLFDSFHRFLAKALKIYTRSHLKQTYNEVRDTVQFSNHFTGQLILTKVSRMLELVEGESIRFSEASDVDQTCHLLRHRIEAELENIV
ncbi:hypothetical protein BDV26DRAFT_288257 [Aspergillus bertholletiae]|uniref:DUF7708 domain-containing protein n=1 Tax=Aspergillus bertholletiae TaxID=1226010 RepID=A0A5N7BLM1_9EURO|nr:hypothetical protein BDV26DRAFT_288257 [Aspergillus bertholletiae]